MGSVTPNQALQSELTVQMEIQLQTHSPYCFHCNLFWVTDLDDSVSYTHTPFINNCIKHYFI
jgi:hypothetical protein